MVKKLSCMSIDRNTSPEHKFFTNLENIFKLFVILRVIHEKSHKTH